MRINKFKKILSYIAEKLHWAGYNIERNHKILEVVLTAIAILVATILFIETHKQVKVASDALDFQKRQWTSDSISRFRSDSSTGAFARETYIEENRPYVFPDIPTLHFPHGIEWAQLPIVNHGHTPAYNVNCCIFLERTIKERNPKKFNYDSTWAWKVLAPNSTDMMIFERHKGFWDTSKNAHIFLIGKIGYHDGWSTKLHFVTFVYQWRDGLDSFIKRYEYDTTDYEKKQTNK
jgi:hypothetical protein